jgi:hypothetical protein
VPSPIQDMMYLCAYASVWKWKHTYIHIIYNICVFIFPISTPHMQQPRAGTVPQWCCAVADQAHISKIKNRFFIKTRFFYFDSLFIAFPPSFESLHHFHRDYILACSKPFKVFSTYWDINMLCCHRILHVYTPSPHLITLAFRENLKDRCLRYHILCVTVTVTVTKP